jgi:hypothetical protein
MYETPPVLLLIFNRPELTEKVMEKIRRAEPGKLFVGADGPRKDQSEDEKRCEQARRVATQVDWDCELHTQFRNENLGCRKAVSSAITWFFNHVEEGVILEDDCVPSDSFFGFSGQMLEEYRSDERIMMISGTNVNGEWNSERQDYHYSRYGGIWGWATWRESWETYNSGMDEWGSKKCKRLMRGVMGDEHFKRRKSSYDKSYNGEVDTWDYIWSFYRIINSGLSVVPSKNMVSNIGFGERATHTTNKYNERSNLDRYNIDLPVSVNSVVLPDKEYDDKFIGGKNLFEKIYYKVKNKL